MEYLLPKIACALIALICKSLRTRVIGGENVELCRDKTGNAVFALWHNRNLLPMYINRGRGINVLASRSRDGELASRILADFGFRVVRGSTGKGGGRALAELIRRINAGEDAAVNPDGPQGPKCRAHTGVVHLSAKTSRPIIPTAYSARAGINLNSWDNFIIPMPFTRAVVVYGKPVPLFGKESTEAKRETIERKLNEVTALADEYCGSSRAGSVNVLSKGG